jgi:hypothetical protein
MNKYIQKINIHSQNKEDNNMSNSNIEDKTLSNFDLEGFANMHSMPKDANSEKLYEAIRQNVASHTQTIETDCDLYKEVKGIADIIASRHIDITSGYQNWLCLGFSLADGLGEDGREFFHELSQMNADYNATECDKKYTSCLKGSSNGNGNGITINTFFKMAKDAGVNLSEIAKERIKSNHSQKQSLSHNSANNAILPSAKSIENIGKSTILGNLDNEMPSDTLALLAQNNGKGSTSPSCPVSGYTFSDKIKIEDLPTFLSPIFDVHQDVVCRDKMLLGVLNVISGLMGGANGNEEAQSGIYGIYDGRRVYAPLFNIIFGTAGSAKGDLAFCKLLARPIKMEMRRQYEAEKAKYEEEMADYEANNKGKKKGERSTPPKEPAFRDPFMPGNSSSAAVYRALDANGGWGMMYETEADTISQMTGTDYGNYSDFMRKAYHHEPVSMNRVSDKIHIDIESPRLSICITCTPGQLPSLFPTFENGLGSRFQFYELPDEKVEFHDVFAQTDNPLEYTYKQMGEELLPLYHAMQQRVGHPIQFVLSKAQQKKFLDTYGEVLVDQFQMYGIGMNAFIFRTALANFRYAMILTALRRLSEWNKQDGIFSDDENALVCDDKDFDIAMEIVGCLVNHTARVYSVLAKESENPFANKGINLSSEELRLYNAIPAGEIKTKDFICIAESFNVSKRTAHRILGKFSSQYGILSPVRHGAYYKSAPRV